jgi:hypothetical protein
MNILILLILCCTCSLAGATTPLLIAGLASGGIFQLDLSSGMVDSVATEKNATLGISCARGGASGEFLFYLNRASEGVELRQYDVSGKRQVSSSLLPFYKQSSKEEFSEGLDYYMDYANTSRGRLSIVGPDEIQFIHMLEASVMDGKLSYSDILQYPGGVRLKRGCSAFDVRRHQHWLQVAYDVSNSTESVVGIIRPKLFLKRYDIPTSTVLDIVPDIGTSVLMHFDPTSGNLFTIGWCPNGSKRCIFVMDKFGSNPALRVRAELPQTYANIMSGVSFVDNHGVFYFVVQVLKQNPPVHHSLLQCVEKDTAICWRVGDELPTSPLNEKDWYVVGVSTINGKVVQEKQLSWNKMKPSILTCGK